MSFSERYGYKPVRNLIQLDSMDEALRNGLWSLLKIHCWDFVRAEAVYGGYYLSDGRNHEIMTLCENLWLDYFRKPLDQLNNDWAITLRWLREYFFNCQWHEVYDFIEFVASHYNRHQFRGRFTEACNSLLEKDMSAYRFVDGVITRITEEQEVAEIEQAMETSRSPVKDHLRRALEMLSDRKSPDYRNSIKESISAVESLVKVILKSDKGTLGELIKKLEDEIGLHPALKAAFGNLYGYTSDEGGIRHALMEADRVDFIDAKFMLVICSTFINFVEGKVKSST